ncbi:hypothetical protein JCM10212_004057 [Sporobolomyces blumeae]
MTSWDLSPLYRHSSSLLLPDDRAVVSTHNDKVLLRDAQTLQIIRTWSLHGPTPKPPARKSPKHDDRVTPPRSSSSSISSPLTSFAVSPTAPHLILAYASAVSTAWVLDPEHDEPVAKLEVGAEGSVAMAWSAAGNVVMSWSRDHLRLSLFRISDPSIALHIHSPKTNHPDGYSFRPNDGRYLAVLERHANRDCVGIYDTLTWSLLRNIVISDPASDLANLSWSPCGRYIATWSSVTHYYLHIYAPDGRHLSTYAPYSSLEPQPSVTATKPAAPRTRKPALTGRSSTPTHPRAGKPPEPNSIRAPAARDGDDPSVTPRDRMRLERSTSAWVGLGIRTVEWEPSGEFLAIGGYDGKVRILSRLTWSAIAELACPTKMVSPTIVWKEPQDWIEKTLGKGIVAFEPASLPFSPVLVQPDMARPNPRMGFSELSWSRDGRWLACYNQSYPTNLCIFSILTDASPGNDGPDRSIGSARPTFNSRPRLDTVIVLNQPVRSFEWKPRADPASATPRSDLLAIVSGTKSFTLFVARPPRDLEPNVLSPTGPERPEPSQVEGVGIPTGPTPFAPSSIQFSRDGRALLVSERGSTFCVAYPVDALGPDGIGEVSLRDGDKIWLDQ